MLNIIFLIVKYHSKWLFIPGQSICTWFTKLPPVDVSLCSNFLKWKAANTGTLLPAPPYLIELPKNVLYLKYSASILSTIFMSKLRHFVLQRKLHSAIAVKSFFHVNAVISTLNMGDAVARTCHKNATLS